MRKQPKHAPVRLAALALLFAATPSCGGEVEKYDWRNREIPWSYAPTKSSASAEHLAGTGTKGGSKIAQGWKFRLVDGKQLTVAPFELSKSHALFGEVRMAVGLFDKDSQMLATEVSAPITAENASFTFDVEPDAAKALWDVVVSFQKKD